MLPNLGKHHLPVSQNKKKMDNFTGGKQVLDMFWMKLSYCPTGKVFEGISKYSLLLQIVKIEKVCIYLFYYLYIYMDFELSNSSVETKTGTD